MNSVHEPGPNGDSETLPSRKTRLKTKPSARAPKLVQLARLGAHWRAQARAWPRAGGRIVAGSRPCRGQGPVVSWAPQRRVVRPAPCHSAPAAVSQAQLRAAGRVVGLAVHCITTQCPTLPLIFQLDLVMIQCLYRDPACLPSQVSCNTLPNPSCLKLSQYTNCIATHFPVKPVPKSRYNSLYLDTAH